MTAGPVVALTGVAHTYGRTEALRGVSFSAARGEVVAVTGPSGCGKSTLLHVSVGLLRPRTGRVELFGVDLQGRDEALLARVRRRTVGIVMQYGQLVPDLSLTDNVALPLLLEGRPFADARHTAESWLARVGLAGCETATPAEISGGQAQRAAIARALVTTPRLVVADEPVASLDTRGGDDMMRLLVGHVRTYGATMLLVTHDNTIAARADREVRLRDGVVDYQVKLS
ncbi:MAG TPA: ATP-binding cassette domain-containing protein [Nocardioidaceae bacterium]|nr:ATP-binding cassette domain-containing protein [Nocardioidaceae bacterium]